MRFIIKIVLKCCVFWTLFFFRVLLCLWIFGHGMSIDLFPSPISFLWHDHKALKPMKWYNTFHFQCSFNDFYYYLFLPFSDILHLIIHANFYHLKKLEIILYVSKTDLKTVIYPNMTLNFCSSYYYFSWLASLYHREGRQVLYWLSYIPSP